MKKLMTMIAAVASAFGLYAATVADTGTGFEGSAGGALADVSGTLSELGEANYWNLASMTDEVSVVLHGQQAKYSDANRPKQIKDLDGEDNDYYLQLKTGSKTLTRYALGVDGSDPIPYNVANNGNYFFDSVVKLTAFDSKPEIDAGAKLALWLKDGPEWEVEAEKTTTTNLMVTVDGTDYDCGKADALLNTWARITIKALPINDKDAAAKIGFVIYVEQSEIAFTGTPIATTGLNPVAKVYAEANKLFPLASGTTIESVGFKGQGSVDDLVFTQTAPGFAEDPSVAEIDWTPANFASLTIGDHTLTGTELAAGSYNLTLAEDQTTVVIKWIGSDKVVDNAEGKTFDIVNDKVDLKNAVQTAVALFGTTKYATVSDAIDAANVDGATGTLKLLADATTTIGIEDNTSGTITIDFGGKNLTVDTKAYAVRSFEDATVIVTNSANTGLVTGKVGGDGSLTIWGGTYAVKPLEDCTIPTGKKMKQNESTTYWELVDINYATLTISTDAGVASVAVTDADGKPYETGAKFDADDAVKLDVAYTLVAGKKVKGTVPTSVTMTKDQTITIETEDITYTVTWEGSENVVVSNDTAEVSGGAFLPNTVLTFYATEGEITNVTVNGDAATVANPFVYTVTADATLVVLAGKAGSDYPPFIPTDDPDVKAKYDTWKTKACPTGDNPLVEQDDLKDAFLLDCDPGENALEAAKAAFKVISITPKAEGGWDVKVAGDKGQDEVYGNGYVNIISVKEAKFPTAGDAADFFQAQLTIQLEK